MCNFWTVAAFFELFASYVSLVYEIFLLPNNNACTSRRAPHTCALALTSGCVAFAPRPVSLLARMQVRPTGLHRFVSAHVHVHAASRCGAHFFFYCNV